MAACLFSLHAIRLRCVDDRLFHVSLLHLLITPRDRGIIAAAIAVEFSTMISSIASETNMTNSLASATINEEMCILYDTLRYSLRDRWDSSSMTTEAATPSTLSDHYSHESDPLLTKTTKDSRGLSN